MEDYKEKEVITNMDINKMTAAEMLDYLRKDVFGSMGIDIDSVPTFDEDKRKWATVSIADQLIGKDANGDFARQLAFSFFDETKALIPDTLYPVADNPLLKEPQEGLTGWIVELMRLMALLFINDPFSHAIDLNRLDSRFPPMEGEGTEQFSPSNRELIKYLPADMRTGALLAKMVYAVACVEAEKIDDAIFDFYVFSDNRAKPDFTDKVSCFGYIDRLRDAIDDVELHLRRGNELGLTIEEIGLVDSLWTEIPHNYPENYVDAAHEIWSKIKPIRDGFDEKGRKSPKDCDLFINDMVEIVLPITEKYEVDMELDDEFSMPLDYLKHWLSNIYYGNDPVFG